MLPFVDFPFINSLGISVSYLITERKLTRRGQSLPTEMMPSTNQILSR